MATKNAQDELLTALSAAITKQTGKKVHVADVVRHGASIVIPEGMKYEDAILNLQHRAKYENELVALSYDFDYFVFDGAHALAKVMEDRYGFVFGQTTYSFFEGEQPPQLLGIEVRSGEMVQVPWGQFTVPGIQGGKFNCGMFKKEGKIIFRLSVTCARKYEGEVKELRDKVQAYLEKNSIYRGKAISIRFTDDDDELLVDSGVIPQPKFLDISKAREEELVFSDDVADAIYTNLFTPIDRIDDVRASGVPIKRGVLLVGDFGVGKTLSAYVAAQKAVKKNITYIYCQEPKEFVHVMRLAAQYAPSLVFCEDVDRIVPENRDEKVDELINTIDGVETKNREIITVFTTNSVDKVNQALLRPGRMDAVIHIKRPDAKAVSQLVRNYCGKLLDPTADLSEVGVLLQDNIPAVIREVCERSKLAAYRFVPEGKRLTTIPTKALVESAKTMRMQLDLLNRTQLVPKAPEVIATEKVAASLSEIAQAIAGNRLQLPSVELEEDAIAA